MGPKRGVPKSFSSVKDQFNHCGIKGGCVTLLNFCQLSKLFQFFQLFQLFQLLQLLQFTQLFQPNCRRVGESFSLLIADSIPFFGAFCFIASTRELISDVLA